MNIMVHLSHLGRCGEHSRAVLRVHELDQANDQISGISPMAMCGLAVARTEFYARGVPLSI